MNHPRVTPRGLHFVAGSPVAGLAVAERRVAHPEATVICVHGGLDRAGSFARLARRIDTFDLVAYDRRGYQGSRDLAPLGLEHHVQDMMTIAEHESRRAPVILFGHSYGGVIALAGAIKDPSLASLVLVYESPLPWILQRESSRPVPGEDPAHEAEIFFQRVVSKGAWERLSEAERESRRLDGRALLGDLRSLRGSAPFDLGELRTPAVYVHGDGVLSPYYRALGVEIARVNPAVTSYELTKAGHGAHLSTPDQLAQVIHDMWDKTCASA